MSLVKRKHESSYLDCLRITLLNSRVYILSSQLLPHQGSCGCFAPRNFVASANQALTELHHVILSLIVAIFKCNLSSIRNVLEKSPVETKVFFQSKGKILKVLTSVTLEVHF